MSKLSFQNVHTLIQLLSVVLLLHCTVAVPTARQTTQITPLSSLRAVTEIQRVWDDTKTFKARFEQVVFSKGLGTREKSTGTLYVSKPDQLRWESEDGSLQILSKGTLWVIQPNRRRVGRIVDHWPKALSAGNAHILGFIAGTKKLDQLYQIKPLPEEKSFLVFRFIPKEEDRETLVAKITKSNYLLNSLISESLDSRVILELTDIETNITLQKSLFEFKPNKDDVVHKN